MPNSSPNYNPMCMPFSGCGPYIWVCSICVQQDVASHTIHSLCSSSVCTVIAPTCAVQVFCTYILVCAAKIEYGIWNKKCIYQEDKYKYFGKYLCSIMWLAVEAVVMWCELLYLITYDVAPCLHYQQNSSMPLHCALCCSCCMRDSSLAVLVSWCCF